MAGESATLVDVPAGTVDALTPLTVDAPALDPTAAEVAAPTPVEAPLIVDVPAVRPRRPRPVLTARRLGTKKDVAVRLNVSEDSIYRYVRDGQLPQIVVRLPSGRVRYDLDALDRLIESWKADGR